MTTKVVVTGGAGFVGSRVVAQLASQGIEVAVFDNLASGLPLPSAARAVVGDIRDADVLTGFFRSFRPNAVIHLAAVHHIPTCETQRAYSLDVNIVGTENVLKASEVCGTQKVILASSGAVYAWEDGPLREDSRMWSADNYAAAKACNEAQLRFWADRTSGVGIVARIFNVIGKGDPNAHLIPEVLAQFGGSTGAIQLKLGNLSPRRDYVYVDDVAFGLIALLHDNDLRARFDTFNICSGTELSVEQLVRKIGAVLGRRIDIAVEPARQRKIDRPSQLGVNAKIRTDLGWAPRFGIDDALQNTLL
jgi:UDP-glucose 4-epimerase